MRQKALQGAIFNRNRRPNCRPCARPPEGAPLLPFMAPFMAPFTAGRDPNCLDCLNRTNMAQMALGLAAAAAQARDVLGAGCSIEGDAAAALRRLWSETGDVLALQSATRRPGIGQCASLTPSMRYGL